MQVDENHLLVIRGESVEETQKKQDRSTFRTSTDTQHVVFLFFALIHCFFLEISTSPGVRQDLFKAMLRQNIEWFDHPTNSVGALMTMLGMDASTVQNMTGQSLVGLTILGSFFAGTLRLFCPMTFQLCYLFVLFFSTLRRKKRFKC